MNALRKLSTCLTLLSALSLSLWSVGCGGQGDKTTGKDKGNDETGQHDQQDAGTHDDHPAGSALDNGGIEIDTPADQPAGSALDNGGTEVDEPGAPE